MNENENEMKPCEGFVPGTKMKTCDRFPSDLSTTSLNAPFPCTQPEIPPVEQVELVVDIPSCTNILTSSTSSSLSTMSSAFMKLECLPKPKMDAPNIVYETAVAKAILQKYSTETGNNLFDHLSDIIKHVLDERPENTIDFFEEYSRKVRKEKFHLPERFPPKAIYLESEIYPLAKKFLHSLKLPGLEIPPEPGVAAEGLEEDHKSEMNYLNLQLDEVLKKFIVFNQHVQRLQFYWHQCGFSTSTEDIYELAAAMTRLQSHPSIQQCRFWGIITGLNAQYYIVEAYLTLSELTTRIALMREEMQEKLSLYYKSVLKSPLVDRMGPKLEPGGEGWENYPPEEVEKMKPRVKPLPHSKQEEDFDVPPEFIGEGTNRLSYFVVNALSDDWIELPIVTPQQIKLSRQIKKLLTGDLEEEIISYPEFCGKEKHLLRAIIGRITAGTYIAPQGYYRKMTKREKRLFQGIEDDEEEEEEEEAEDEEEEEDMDNDVFLLKNERYDPIPLTSLNTPSKWVHVRPNILNQGRVVWFDEARARRMRAKQIARLARLAALEEEEEEEEEVEEEFEEEGLEEEMYPDLREYGPNILSHCDEDVSNFNIVPWSTRFTSTYTNEKERVLVMCSNIWPGAFSFTFEDVCESIYLGWGHKYVARNMPFEHMPIQYQEYPHLEYDFIEAIDPSVEDELAYELAMRRKMQKEMAVDGEEFDDDFDDITIYDDDDV
ncbi:radial spoke head protein 4 homolog A-like [Teleopsis dalmanni]|uniref:radial spoke head protein 4 homolog A-like n=1 Tax=Teleopsis dalmanni TaxID=139649 RepID=UPI0018CEF851|nr:radial spoke head protein 4 homolog A-like [Teleopsis dalmanni]XP_037953348.1 radial spoke head protein 4 homolog A-like [Teleopsis dalmanni]